MEELERLRARYLSLVAELRRQWCECTVQGQGNTDLAHVLWHLRSTLQQQARSIQLAQEGLGITWLLDECSTQIRCTLRELDPEWAAGKPLWWLWACCKEVSFHRLTRRVATKVLALQTRSDGRGETAAD